MNSSLPEQIRTAFNSIPGRDGTIHGQRRIRQGKHGSRASLFYSVKNKCLIPVESRLEQAFCYELEANRFVSKYRTQALAIPYRGNHLFPDFLLLSVDGRYGVREVKCSAFVNSPKNIEKANFLSAYFRPLDIDFGVVTERDFWSGQAKINRVMCYDRGGRFCRSGPETGLAVQVVLAMDPWRRSIREIREKLRRNQLPHYLLEAAIFAGLLKCDMSRPISDATRIEVQT